MPDRPPNQIARILAVGGVVTMFLLVIVVVASSAGGGGDSGGADSSGALRSGKDGQTSTDPHTAKALDKGVYRVQSGDTLTGISEATGVDIDTLIQLNPDTDPQALIEGRKIKLR